MSEEPTIRERKKSLRAEMKRKLGEFSVELRSLASEKIAEALVAHPWWNQAGQVALFSSRPDEPETTLLIQAAWRQGRSVLLPKVNAENLEFYSVTKVEELRPGAFDLPEPDSTICQVVEPSELELILVPGLAFDRKGFRLGRGKGFYDRLMEQPGFQARKIGLFFACQEVDQVPVEAHDRKLDAVLTERGIF